MSKELPGSDDLVNNILPSYQMFQSTISKKLNSSEEDYSREPPNYEVTPVSSATSLSGMRSPFSPVSSTSMSEFPFPIMDQTDNEQIEIWENTILANVHKLKNLSKTDNKVAKELEIHVHMTRNVCQKGVEPEIIDPSGIEFKQGDYIHGYVTIENTSDVPIRFDMVYVVFEGTLIILKNEDGLIDTQVPQTVHKFLNMTDLFASWSFANIDRLTTDNGDPHDWCEGDIDPWDNTLLSLDLKRTFLPHVKYKRFFTFRVPDKLLDDICETHNLDGHTQLVSSLGFPKYSMRPSSLLSKKGDTVNDLCFLDTSVNYSVECRVLGRAHEYDLENIKDQYVIASESIQPVRVVPIHTVYLTEDEEENTRYYQAFVKSIDDQIDFGKTLLSSSESLKEFAISPVSSTDSKLRQLYSSSSRYEKKSNTPQCFEDLYQNIIPFKKRSLLSQKATSLVSLATPKRTYKVKYIPPLKFRKQEIDEEDISLSVPLTLTYHTTNGSLPEIKSLKTELVVATMKSSKHAIPCELTHGIFIKSDELEMIGHKSEYEYFNDQVCKPLQKKVKEMVKLIDKVGGETMRVERRTFEDLKSLATLQTKFSSFVVNDTVLRHTDDHSNGIVKDVTAIPWKSESNSSCKTFVLDINLNNCVSRGPKNKSFFDTVTLVPDCQTCYSVRLQYLKVSIKLANGDFLVVRVPLKIENR